MEQASTARAAEGGALLRSSASPYRWGRSRLRGGGGHLLRRGGEEVAPADEGILPRARRQKLAVETPAGGVQLREGRRERGLVHGHLALLLLRRDYLLVALQRWCDAPPPGRRRAAAAGGAFRRRAALRALRRHGPSEGLLLSPPPLPYTK